MAVVPPSMPLDPAQIRTLELQALTTHGTPSHHEDMLVTNILHPIGEVAQRAVAVGRVRLPEIPETRNAR
eukprot:9488315-Pyramimonas_sp.AAC.1